jgi:hypothetical protein
MPLQGKVGWRSSAGASGSTTSVSSLLLDTYSGAAAAYSLRRLTTAYTGSAIRVRRSSDNTELNIGFDSDGNLDTVALSAFVGSGSGFVTTWYDQSGNSRNAINSTATRQPYIVQNGILCTLNGKAIIRNPNAKTISTLITPISAVPDRPVSLIAAGKIYELPVNGYGNVAFYLGGSINVGGGARYEFAVTSTAFSTTRREVSSVTSLNINANVYSPFIQQGHFNSSLFTARVNGNELNTPISDTNQFNPGANTYFTLIGSNSQTNDFMSNIGMYEYIFYFTDKTSDRVGIESNINSYYSVYPNPTSVWNLLAAAYNADTKSLPSLKTSLVAAYNGESNTNDSFGTNNGTAQGGLTYGTGKIGNAFVGNGTNAYVRLPNNMLSFTTFSYSTWVYLKSVPSVPSTLISSFNGNGTTVSYGMIYHVENGGRLKLNVYNTALASSWRTSTILAANQWYHLVVTKVASEAPKFYINGVLNTTNLDSGTNTLNPVYSGGSYTNSLCTIGANRFNNDGTKSWYSNSNIDSATIWTKELTQSEITELYNSGNGAQYIGDNFYKPTSNDALGTNNGTAQGGLTYAPGKIGTAFQFNGTNASVRFPAGSMNFTGDFSISGWVNLSGVYNGTNEATLVVNVTAPSWFNSPKGFWVSIAGNSVNFNIWNGTTGVGCNWDDSTGSIVKANSGWIHIVATRKSSTGSKLYVNGVLKASNTSTVNPTYDPTYQTPNMGSRYILNSSGSVVNSSVFAPDGTKMDGLSVWQKELTQAEVTELYNSGNGKQYPN